MASQTTNLKLTKPSPDDFYNIDDFNNNAEKIDKAFGEQKNTLDTLKTSYDALGLSVVDGMVCQTFSK